jgi:hypothetical protein
MSHGECFAIALPRFFSREIMKVVIRVIALPPVLLKGNYECIKRAIAHGECFANPFPRFFSRENLRVVKQAIAPSECFANAFQVL